MRLFVALDVPDAVRQAIATYVDDLRRVAPEAKWVRADSYHITLKFIGEWRRDVSEVIEALQKVEAPPVTVSMRGNGFFPSEKVPRVFWVGIQAQILERSAECGDGLPSPSGRSEAPRTTLSLLARTVDEACSTLGIERESHEFSPHLTLARSGSGSPRPRKDERSVPGMKRLAERIATMPSPEFGTIHATEFFLYESKLSPSGAKYTKLKSFRLS
jgi:RNA 2',3'-cyclic 3'-phosphodiesterase